MYFPLIQCFLYHFSVFEMSDPISPHDLYDYLFKFLVIGSAGTGKSCLLHQFIEGRFKDDSSHTIGVEFGSKIVPVGGKSVKLQASFLAVLSFSFAIKI